MADYRFPIALALIFCLVLGGFSRAPAKNGMVFDTASDASQTSAPPARMRVAQVPPPPQTDPEHIGSVATVQGDATVTRSGAAAAALKAGDGILKGDVLQTGADGALGVTFDDETTFNLSANTRIVVNEFVYQQGATNNAAVFNVVRGTVAFVASQIAKTGDMKITTPTATLGIRGTTGVIEVPDDVAPGGSAQVAVKLYADSGGTVGRIEVFATDGARLGLLNRVATGFSIRPGPTGRFAAVALRISAQEAARDRAVVQRLFTAHNLGRQFINQRRILRQNLPKQFPNLKQKQFPNLKQPNLQQNLQKQTPALQNAPAGQKQLNLKKQPNLKHLPKTKDVPKGNPLNLRGLPNPLGLPLLR